MKVTIIAELYALSCRIWLLDSLPSVIYGRIYVWSVVEIKIYKKFCLGSLFFPEISELALIC